MSKSKLDIFITGLKQEHAQKEKLYNNAVLRFNIASKRDNEVELQHFHKKTLDMTIMKIKSDISDMELKKKNEIQRLIVEFNTLQLNIKHLIEHIREISGPQNLVNQIKEQEDQIEQKKIESDRIKKSIASLEQDRNTAAYNEKSNKMVNDMIKKFEMELKTLIDRNNEVLDEINRDIVSYTIDLRALEEKINIFSPKLVTVNSAPHHGHHHGQSVVVVEQRI